MNSTLAIPLFLLFFLVGCQSGSGSSNDSDGTDTENEEVTEEVSEELSDFIIGDGQPTDVKTYPLSNPDLELSIGIFHVCMILEGDVHCGGREDFEWVQPPEDMSFVNPKQVVNYDYRTCVLDQNGVQCWGRPYDNAGELSQSLSVPALTSPSFLAMYRGTVCAVDGNSVVCWGGGGTSANGPYSSFENEFAFPPTDIAISDDHLCVLVNDVVDCWQYGSYIGTPAGLEGMSQPKQLAATDSNICVLDSGAIRCTDDSIKKDTLESFENPVDFELTHRSDNDDWYCAVSNDETQCYRSPEGVIQLPIGLENVKKARARGNYNCATDSNGLVCFGSTGKLVQNDFHLVGIPEAYISPYASDFSIEEEFIAGIVGTWELNDSGGEVLVTYYADGTGTSYIDVPGFVYEPDRRFTWRISGKRLYLTYIDDSGVEGAPSIIEQLTVTTLILENPDTGRGVFTKR